MKNNSVLITAAGVVIFLFAGIFTMLFFPSEKESPVKNSKPIETQKIIFQSQDIETVSENPKVEIKNEKPKKDWYVYVIGEVKNPGYYKISPDTRIFNAVELAGGFTKKADITSINMAAPLVDGLQINIGAKGTKKLTTNNITIPGLAKNRAPIVVKTQAVQTQNNSNLVDINNADAKELEKLKGVGPAIAKRIIEYRNSHGRFSSPEDLLQVKGIGNAKLEKMRSQILIR